jgi:hypothetical protein
MKVLNRNQELIVGSLMRGVRVPTGFAFAALAPAGCMQTTYPAASAGRDIAPLGTTIGPGDTIVVGERWS